MDIISTGIYSFVKIFIPKHACFAFSPFKLLGELLVATFERGVFGFRCMCASNIENFVEPCGVTLNVLKNSAHRKRVCTVCLVDRFSLPLTCFLMSVSFSQLPILLNDRLARQKMILYCRYCNLV